VKKRGAVLLLSCLAALAACSDSNGKKKPEPSPVPVTTATVTENDIPVTLQVVGRAEAYESVSLKARVDGQVSTVLFTEGQHVNQGDVLIRLDPTDFAARLQQAAATTARDEALMTKSRHDTARYSALKGRNFVSEEKVHDVRTSEATASANLRASKAAEEVARLQLSYTTIRAPFTGVVGARLVFPGSSIKVNDTILAVVNRVRPLLISFSIPEKHLPRLRESMKTGRMKVNINLPGDASQRFEGNVHFIDNAVDPATGTILLKATLPNDDEKLTSGQFLNVSLTLNTLTKAVTVPNEAVQQGSEGNFVFIVNEDSSVEIRKIIVIASSGGITAVKSGLQNGEVVVTDGQLRLAPGVKTKTREAPSPSTPPKPNSANAPVTPSIAK
jgi:multidrug efflux system membrane fusion protein